MAGDGRLRSPAFERNAEPIRSVLADLLGPSGTVLEIGSGPGQHAAHFARAFPQHRWVPTDPEPGHLASIAAWARDGPANLSPAVRLDVTEDWAARPDMRSLRPDAVFAANVLHVAPWPVMEGIVQGAGRLLDAGGRLIIYGPFRIGDRHTGPGNQAFDMALRSRDPRWGVRDVDDVAALAGAAGFGPPRIIAMPADNRTVFFRRC